MCHGASGKGDGPVGRSLNPKPANFTDKAMMAMHSDEELFKTISNGVKGTAMVGFANSLSVADRWNLVAYIRSLSR